jgi:hypothetical protein
VKSKFVLGVLTVTGILALSSTVAQAGAGGVPVPLTSFFSCHAISGVNLGIPVDVYSDETADPSTRTDVVIGQAALACAQVFLWPTGANPVQGTDINPKVAIPPPGTGFLQLRELKCYTAETPGKKTGQTTLFNVIDRLFGGLQSLFGGTESVQGTPDTKYICGPAGFSQPQ